ncbi:AraC family transcriptional regulator [Fibrisoma montanum]|uniref:AraC family transcriptional regulator n=1 Tax=Fibrisoma montanum TaxID=2305895 RepID=A0A418MHX4_9BACT|nr:helix-turn-helix domain-containing protein [Fibrisoma montanum]RIV27025.1 AraC family transcriptional regulator [Fibrisoma montanum]
MQQSRVLFEEETASYFRIAYPSRPLQSLAAYYFEINLTGQNAQPLLLNTLPNVTSVINVNLSEVGWLSCNTSTGKQTAVSGTNLFGAVSDALVNTYPAGVHDFCIKLKPGAVGQLTKLPGTELANQFTTLSDLLRLPGFTEQIQRARTFSQRVQVAEAALLPLVGTAHDNWRYELVQRVINRFDTVDTLGDDHLYTLCRHLGVSYSSLHRHFTTVVGYSPKYCQQLIRFKHALKCYREHGSTFAFDTIGYTDFSHFVRASKQLTRRSPSAL